LVREARFRQTYDTFRLTEGVDGYFLAEQMGTSVKMIEDHYGHITPVRNADRILMGLSGWQSGPEAVYARDREQAPDPASGSVIRLKTKSFKAPIPANAGRG
jgi:hypothetical protein